MKKFHEARFYAWNELDKLLAKWAKDYFGPGVRASTTSDDDVPDNWYVLLTGLRPRHRTAFDGLFELYSEDMDANLEWPGTDQEASELPQCVSNGILYIIIGEVKIAESIAGYDGVYLMVGEADLT